MIRSPIRVGLNPNMSADQRHGVAWFNVSGFGIQKRDFMVDLPELLEQPTKELVHDVFRQIAILDKTLPKKEINCRPVNIDLMVGNTRRVYRFEDFEPLLVQSL